MTEAVNDDGIDLYEESFIAVPLSKEAFLQQFVLNRAGFAMNGTDGTSWARQAISAWTVIKEELEFRPE